MTDGPTGIELRPASALSRDDELRPVTSLFADVVGSTSLGERLSPSEVKTLIGECVSRMCEVIERYGGAVRSFMGDGIAAFFGIDGTREDDADRAARAAMDIRSLVGDYSDEVRAAWGISDFNVRIGINTGRVATGQVGAGEPQRVALGDAVNVAARLQSAAQPGAILVGAATATALKERFSLQSLGALAVKGRRMRVEAYQLNGEGAPQKRRFTSSFVGRVPELEVIDSVVGDLLAGRGQVCLILGEGGLGKSRLLAEVRRRVSSDVQWLGGTCDPMDQRLPYEAIAESLRRWLGVDRHASAIETRVKLQARGREVLGDQFEDSAPHLARLLGIELGPKLDRRLEGLPEDVLTSGLQRSITDLLIALGSSAPVVIAIDNFGSASQPTADLIEATLEALDRAPILLVLTLRPDVLSPGWRVRTHAQAYAAHRCVEVRLQPLAPDESQRLVEELDRDDGLLDRRLRELVVERAEGSPLYIEELYAAIANSARQRDESDVSTSLPAPLEGLLLARIDALPDHAKRVLQAAAVLGRTFARDVLISMMGDVEAVDAALPVLLRADAIREHGRQPATFGFRHGLVREAALSTLIPNRYRSLNALAAAALTEWHGFDSERDAERLAGYYLASGDLEHAVECLELLGDRMAMVYRYDDAGGLYRRCLEELRSSQGASGLARITCKYAEILSMRGDDRSAIELLDEAIDRGCAGQDLFEVLLGKARLLGEGGRTTDAESIIQRCLELTDDEANTVRAVVLRGEIALSLQDFDLARQCVDELNSCGALPLDVEFDVASLAAGVSTGLSDLKAAERYATRAQSLADQLGRLTTQLKATRRLAVICAFQGDVRRAYALSREVYARCSELQFSAGRLDSAVNVLQTAYLTGELNEAISIGQSELASPSLTGLWDGMVSANLLAVFHDLNEMNTVVELAHRILALDVELPGWVIQVARLGLIGVALATNDFDEARDQLRRASLGTPHQSARTRSVELLTRAEIANVSGDRDAALKAAADAYSLREALDRVSCVQTERLCAWIQRHDVSNIVERVTSTLQAARQMGLRLEEARCLVLLGSLQPEHSDEYFAQAREIFEDCGCKRGLIELEEERAKLGQRVST